MYRIIFKSQVLEDSQIASTSSSPGRLTQSSRTNEYACITKKYKHNLLSFLCPYSRGTSGSIEQKKFSKKLVDPTGSSTTDTTAITSDS